MSLKRSYKTAVKAHERYIGWMGILEEELKEFVKFDFSVDYMAGDGLLILNEESTSVATVMSCIDLIDKYGELTEDDHERAAI